MGLSKGLYVAAIMAGVSVFSTAAFTAGASYSVLPPGARVVAGDLSKNEFYILASGQKQASIVKAENTKAQPEISTSTVAAVEPMPKSAIKMAFQDHPSAESIHHAAHIKAKHIPKSTVLSAAQVQKKLAAQHVFVPRVKTLTELETSLRHVAHKKKTTVTAL